MIEWLTLLPDPAAVAAVQDYLVAIALLTSLLLQALVVVMFPRPRAARRSRPVVAPRPQYSPEATPEHVDGDPRALAPAA